LGVAAGDKNDSIYFDEYENVMLTPPPPLVDESRVTNLTYVAEPIPMHSQAQNRHAEAKLGLSQRVSANTPAKGASMYHKSFRDDPTFPGGVSPFNNHAVPPSTQLTPHRSVIPHEAAVSFKPSPFPLRTPTSFAQDTHDEEAYFCSDCLQPIDVFSPSICHISGRRHTLSIEPNRTLHPHRQ
jgi:hypothetical protein